MAMGEVIELSEASAALMERRRARGTGFAYCPPPCWLTERAYDRQSIYAGDVVIFMALGVFGAVWIIGAGVLSAVTTIGHVGSGR
jgi:hypothetical protein